MLSAHVHLVPMGGEGLVFRAWASSVGEGLQVEFCSCEPGHSVAVTLSAPRVAWREFIADLGVELDHYDHKDERQC
jgi:hypothetical protein